MKVSRHVIGTRSGAPVTILVYLGLLLSTSISAHASTVLNPVWPGDPTYGGGSYSIIFTGMTNMEIVKAEADVVRLEWAIDTNATNAFIFFRVWVRQQVQSQLTSTGHSIFLDTSGDDVFDYVLYNTTQGADKSALDYWDTGQSPPQWDTDSSPPAQNYTGGLRDFDTSDNYVEFAVPITDIGADPHVLLARSTGKGRLDLNGDTNNYSSVVFDDDEQGIMLDVDKAVSATSCTGATESTGSELQIGEVVTYRITVAVPQATLTNLTVTDYVPAGMAYVKGSVQLDTNTFIGTLGTLDVTPDGTGLGASGGDVVITYSGESSVPPDSPASNQYFDICLDTVVLDEPGNVGGADAQTALTNRAQVSYTDIQFQPPESSDVAVTVIEPELVCDLVAQTPSSGSVSFDVTVTNTGLASAYDIVLEVPFPSANWNTTSVTASVPAGFTWSISGAPGDAMVTIEADGGAAPPDTSVEPGEELTFQFSALLRDSAPSAFQVTGIVVSNSTINGVDSYEREEPPVDTAEWIYLPDIVATLKGTVPSGVPLTPNNVLECRLDIVNNGNLAATDLEVLCPVPGYTSLDTNSVTLNGTNVVSLTPVVKIAVPSVAGLGTAVVEFDLILGTPPVGVDEITCRTTVTWAELTRTEVADNDPSGADSAGDDGQDDAADVGSATDDDDATVIPVTVPVGAFAITSMTLTPSGTVIRWESKEAVLYKVEESVGDLESFLPLVIGLTPTPPENVWTNPVAPSGNNYFRVVGYR